jgi:hypothetical protein
LRLSGGAAARRLDRFEMDWSLPVILIFEMRDGRLVADLRMEINHALLPFQFGAGANTEQNRQRKSKDSGFHFFE